MTRYIITAVALLTIILAGFWYINAKDAPRREAYKELANCLSEKEAIFYGAFWCPNCGQQKALFGSAQKNLPYIECSEPKGAQTEECKEIGITNYPTWRFTDGTQCIGMISGEVLAHIAGCPLPTYGEKEHTAKTIYEDLVLKVLKKNATKNKETPQEKIDEALAEAEKLINKQLNDRFNTSIEKATVEQLLSVIAVAMNQCTLITKE